MARGSWPPLLLAAAVFLGAFVWLRGGSTVLAVEARAAEVAGVAKPLGVPLAEALAVCVMAPADGWREALAAFAAARDHLGEALAAVAVFGDRAAAEAARGAGPDATTAWAAFRVRPAAEPGLRFLELRERFAARAVARD